MVFRIRECPKLTIFSRASIKFANFQKAFRYNVTFLPITETMSKRYAYCPKSQVEMNSSAVRCKIICLFTSTNSHGSPYCADVRVLTSRNTINSPSKATRSSSPERPRQRRARISNPSRSRWRQAKRSPFLPRSRCGAVTLVLFPYSAFYFMEKAGYIYSGIRRDQQVSEIVWHWHRWWPIALLCSMLFSSVRLRGYLQAGCRDQSAIGECDPLRRNHDVCALPVVPQSAWRFRRQATPVAPAGYQISY